MVRFQLSRRLCHRLALVLGLAVAVLLSCVRPASAAIIYQTGFEPPTYTLGTLSGQDNWSSSSIPVVQNGTVLSGTQAAEFDASLLPSGQSVILHPLAYSSVGNPEPLVRIQEAFFLSTTGRHSIWDVIAVGGNNGFIGQVLVAANDTALLGLASTTVGSVPVTRGQWNLFELDLNFQTQMQSAFVNGVFIGQGAFAHPTTSLASDAFGVNFFPGSDQAFVDDLSVTSSALTALAIPEPSTLAILGSSLAGLMAGPWWRRRTRAA